MGNEAYSAYPSEEEILLCDGCDMFALSVDSNIQLNNMTGVLSDFNNRILTVIHLFHTGTFEEENKQMKYLDELSQKTSWNNDECSKAGKYLASIKGKYESVEINGLISLAEKTNSSYKTWLKLSECAE